MEAAMPGNTYISKKALSSGLFYLRAIAKQKADDIVSRLSKRLFFRKQAHFDWIILFIIFLFSIEYLNQYYFFTKND